MRFLPKTDLRRSRGGTWITKEPDGQPPVLAPNENNWLINPAHPDYKRIVVREVEPLSYARRTFRKQRSHRRH